MKELDYGLWKLTTNVVLSLCNIPIEDGGSSILPSYDVNICSNSEVLVLAGQTIETILLIS